ncbi:MAG TPA: hypothetical protein VH062_12435 [Polyangiaceae bacterium]|jgi:hypothetical protein|nr:hypothetical protein [Polyangiaceae bacterium]
MRNALLALALCLVGCVEMGHRTAVAVDDFASYRRFRLAPTVEQKLAASVDYLRHNPDGGYHVEVLRWLKHAEVGYVVRAWDDPPRLRAFLEAVPSGAYSGRAAERLVELEITEEYRQKSAHAFDVKAAAMEVRLAKAEAGRRALLRGVVGWARRLSRLRKFGARISELDDDMIFAFRLDPPAARCDDVLCTKTVIVDYDVPEGKAQSAREAIYDIGMRLDHGGVRAAWLTGSELFTRIGEAVRVSAVAPTDLGARVEAIGQATQMIALAVEPALPASRCEADAVSPVVLRRVCDGVELRVTSALELGEEDRISIEPTLGP